MDKTLVERLETRSPHDCNEGHADACACLRPGDCECNCHKAYGFDTAEDMEIADREAGRG